MCEHCIIKGTVLMVARGHCGVAQDKHAEFQQSREDWRGNGVKNLSGAQTCPQIHLLLLFLSFNHVLIIAMSLRVKYVL